MKPNERPGKICNNKGYREQTKKRKKTTDRNKNKTKTTTSKKDKLYDFGKQQQ